MCKSVQLDLWQEIIVMKLEVWLAFLKNWNGKPSRREGRIIDSYYCTNLKGLKGKARIPTDDFIPKNMRCRNQHSLVFQIPIASKDAYKKSFFPLTIRDWNVLPDSLISSAELSDDCVSKLTSLVRVRDKFSSANPLVRYCRFGVSPVNYSDSEHEK